MFRMNIVSYYAKWLNDYFHKLFQVMPCFHNDPEILYFAH